MKNIHAGLLALLLCSCASPKQTDLRSDKKATPVQGATPAIYLVDGIWGSPWDLVPLKQRLNKEVGPARICRYDNSGFTSLEQAGATLAAELRATRQPFYLVGFSMGGLVIREAMRQAPDLPLQKAVLLHSPNNGSRLAHLLPLPACREMRPGSAFLLRLDAAPWHYPTLVTYTPGDLMVYPGESARWSKATHIIRSTVPAHAWPLISPSLQRSVVLFLKAGQP